jgi:hypothetical protein
MNQDAKNENRGLVISYITCIVKDCCAVVWQEFIKFRQYNPAEKVKSRSAQELLNEAAILGEAN